MKKLGTFFTAILIAAISFGQVDIGKAKSTIMGKSKLVATPVSELLLDHFHLKFNLYKFEEDQGGSNNVALSVKVGVRARLGGLDESLAQEITDEAYAYFVDQWRKRDIKVTMADRSVMENSKPYVKAKKKGNASITNGGVYEDKQKKVHTMQAWPNGVDIATSGEGAMANYGNAKHMWQYGVGNSTAFNANIDFISFKTAKIGSTASVKSKPQIKMNAYMGATVWAKNKVGGYIGSIESDGMEDYYSEVKDESMEALGSKVVDRVYIIDREKFKSNVLEVIKKSMDANFADYDEVVAKNS